MKKIHKFVSGMISKAPNLCIFLFFLNICISGALVVINENNDIPYISGTSFLASIIGIFCILYYKNGELPFITRYKTFKPKRTENQSEEDYEEKQKQQALLYASIFFVLAFLVVVFAIIIQALYEF